MVQRSCAFEDLLLRRGVVSPEQLAEAKAYVQQHVGRLAEAIVLLGYATEEEITQILALAHGLEVIDLETATILPGSMTVVPESLAREHVVLPLSLVNGALTVVVSDPTDSDLVQLLQFILNKDIRLTLAPRKKIIEAIERHYGPAKPESIDSIIREFTDTAIDFSESDKLPSSPAESASSLEFQLRPDSDLGDVDSMYDSDLESSDFDLALEDSGSVDLSKSPDTMGAKPKHTQMALDAAARSDAPLMAAAGPPPMAAMRSSRGLEFKGGLRCAETVVERQATVRYYHRMNPQRMFPLLVVLSKKAIQEVVKKHVAQAASKKFQVKLESVVEIEPVLPGCQCYPPRAELAVKERDVETTFWVVPLVLGQVMHARVIVRQDGAVLAEVPLQMKVVRQGLTVLMGCLSFLLPIALMLAKYFGLDFESQMKDGFGLYAQIAGWVMQTFSPEGLAALLLGGTGLTYLWFRPRQRDVFWDIEPARHDPKQPQARPESQPAQLHSPARQAEIFQQAERSMRWKRYDVALRYYEKGLAMAGALRGEALTPGASLAADFCGNTARAIEILKLAESQLGADGMKGSMWYNLACFAAKVGQPADAVIYLSRAADAGYADPQKYRTDPDLNPLRPRSDFKQLLDGIGCGTAGAHSVS